MTITRTRLGDVALAAIVGLCLASFAAGQQTLRGNVLTDKAAGFKITVPSGWVQLPINISEKQIRAWFQSTRSFRGNVKKGDTGWARRFNLRVIRLQKPADPKSKMRQRNYADYLKRALGSGAYEATQTPGTLRSLPIVKWDVRFGGEGTDRARITTWIIPREEYDYAVQFYVLEEHLARHRSVMAHTFASFRFIEANPTNPSVSVKKRPFALRPWLKLPLLERRQQRSAMETDHEKRMLKHLSPGWTSQRSKHFLILSHTSPKITAHVRNTADAFGDWLRDRLGPISDMVPMRATIRICKNSNEYYAYRRGGWRVDYNFANREVEMCNDGGNLNMKDVLWAIYRRYMLDVAPEVFFNTPLWLRKGLYSYFSQARLKGRIRNKLEFTSSLGEPELYTSLRRSKAPVRTMRELLTFDQGEMSESMHLQATTLIRFLEGPGKRYKATGKSFLLHYMKEIQKLVRELDNDDDEVLVWDTEETISDLLKSKLGKGETLYVPSLIFRWTRYQTTVGQRRKSFTYALHKRTCDWTLAEREAVERAFARFYGAY